MDGRSDWSHFEMINVTIKMYFKSLLFDAFQILLFKLLFKQLK